VAAAVLGLHYLGNRAIQKVDWDNLDANEEYNKIKQYMSADIPTVIALGPPGLPFVDSAHSVLAWKVEERPSGEKRIYVYDPNVTASDPDCDFKYFKVGEPYSECGITKPRFAAFLPGSWYHSTNKQDVVDFLLDVLENDPLLELPIFGGVASPVDLVITAPDGLQLSKTTNQIPGAVYFEADLNGDGELDDLFVIQNRKLGIYVIKVVPEPGAHPTDTFTLRICLGGECFTLADSVRISNIPEEGYWILSTDTGLKLIPAKGDVNGDGVLDVLDVRLCLQIATDFLEGTMEQRIAADVDGDGQVTRADAETLAGWIIGIGD